MNYGPLLLHPDDTGDELGGREGTLSSITSVPFVISWADTGR